MHTRTFIYISTTIDNALKCHYGFPFTTLLLHVCGVGSALLLHVCGVGSALTAQKCHCFDEKWTLYVIFTFNISIEVNRKPDFRIFAFLSVFKNILFFNVADFLLDNNENDNKSYYYP